MKKPKQPDINKHRKIVEEARKMVKRQGLEAAKELYGAERGQIIRDIVERKVR